MVPLILLVAAVLFVLLSVVLVCVGVLAIVGHIEGGVGGGIFTIVVGLLPLYLAYLLSRSAWRIRVSVVGASARAKRRSTVTAVVGYMGFLIVANVLAPVPGAVKVLMTIVAIVLVPVLLAAELEPRKPRE
jgi:hypothetical protein